MPIFSKDAFKDFDNDFKENICRILHDNCGEYAYCESDCRICLIPLIAEINDIAYLLRSLL